MKDKKMDLNDLDLSDLGATVPVETGEEEESQDQNTINDGVWVNGTPIEKVNHDEMAQWVANLIPGTRPEGFDKNAFNNTTKRKNAVDRVLLMHFSLQYLFPVKERPQEMEN